MSLAHVQEQRNLKRRELDKLRQELESFYYEQKRHDVASKASQTVLLRATICSARERQAEELATQKREQAQQRYAYRLQKAEEEERLAEDLLKRSHAAAAQQTALERLHQTSPELQELRQAIAAAQIAVERGLQLQEREFASEQERQYQTALDQLQAQKLQQADEADQAAKSLNAAALAQVRRGLDKQLQEKAQLQEEEKELREREREMVDAVVARIEAEDRTLQASRQANRQRLQDAMHQSLADRQRHQAAVRAEEAHEERRIEEYVQQQQQRADEHAAKAAVKQAGHNRMYEQIKARLEAEEAAAQEEQRLVDLLRAEEVAAKARQEAADRAARQAQLRAAMLADNRAQLQHKAEQREKEQQEEEAFRVTMLQRMAEEDRLEQLSAQRRREKTIAHRREVERLLDQRRALFEAAREQELAQAEAAREAVEAEHAAIEAERQRLLAQAEHLHALLPRSVLVGGSKLQPLQAAQLY